MIQEPAAADVGSDYTCAGDGGAEQRCLLAHLIASPVRGAAADAELELAVGKEVCRRDFLGHVERVLVVDVDDTGAP
jgi:hypothetical protein